MTPGDESTPVPMDRRRSPRPHGRPVLDERGFELACDEIEDLVKGLRKEHVELRRRCREDAADGYPPSSLGGGGSPSNLMDDDGTPIPQHSDPVGELVADRDEAPRADPVAAALARMVELVQSARRTLEEAGSTARRMRPPEDASSLNRSREWCWICLDAEPSEVRATYRDSGDPSKGDLPRPRCRDCYDWWRTYKDDPSAPSERPSSIIRVKAEKGRVAQVDVDKAIGEWRRANGIADTRRRRAS